MDHAYIMPALTGLSVMFAMTQYAFLRIARSRRRTEELKQVQELLPRHYSALERVLAAEELPTEMKEIASWISSGIEDKAMATFFVRCALERGTSPPPDRSAVDIDMLRSLKPAAVKSFDEAMSTGILAFLLRWPETARHAETVMTRVFTSSREETATAFRAAKERREADIAPAGLIGAY